MTYTDFENYYTDSYKQHYAVAYRLTGSKEDAEDVIQEAYFNAYNALSTFKGDSSFDTWVYRITINCAKKLMKKRKALPISYMAEKAGISETEFLNQLADVETVEDIVLTENLRETCLKMFLECMASKQRIAFVLKVLMQLSTEEVSEIMDISIGAVKTNVYRARQHMKDNMEGRCSLIRLGNPCDCRIWASYAVQQGKAHYIPQQLQQSNQINAMAHAFEELDFLGKLREMYKVSSDPISGNDFVQRMKELIKSRELRLL